MNDVCVSSSFLLASSSVSCSLSHWYCMSWHLFWIKEFLYCWFLFCLVCGAAWNSFTKTLRDSERRLLGPQYLTDDWSIFCHFGQHYPGLVRCSKKKWRLTAGKQHWYSETQRETACWFRLYKHDVIFMSSEEFSVLMVVDQLDNLNLDFNFELTMNDKLSWRCWDNACGSDDHQSYACAALLLINWITYSVVNPFW